MLDNSPEQEPKGFTLHGRDEVETAWTVANMTGMTPTVGPLLDAMINNLSANPIGSLGLGVGGEAGTAMRNEMLASLRFIIDNSDPSAPVIDKARKLLESLEE